MKITYIYHSGYLTETENAYLLFDYYRGALPALSPEKRLYVLVSHAHSDHFGAVIFSLPERHPDVRFLLSSDIRKREVPESFRASAVFLAPHAEFHDDLLRVETLRSNDAGVAFWCGVDGKELYHAGDLNNWNWDGDEEDLRLIAVYHEELARIRGRTADVAFLPVDPRLGDNDWLGVDDFLRFADARYIFPMHLWRKYEIIAQLKARPETAAYRDRILEVSREGEAFDLT